MADSQVAVAPPKKAPVITPEIHYLNHEKGIKSWLLTVDHKRIGLMYLLSIAIFFGIAGFLALAIRLELLAPELQFVSKDQYNQLFTLHGIMMVFLFIVPSVPASLGNFTLPLMIGAKDVAFPRLNLASYYIYVVGGILAVAAIIFGNVDTGWTFYTPYSDQTDGSVLFMTMAVFVAGFSSILTGLNFITTIHKMRAPGMTWNRLPLMVWGLYATSMIQVLATPVIGITMLLLFMEKTMGIGIFDPALGGDPVLFQHFFWFYSHPAVYIMILPGMGIISELVTGLSRQKVYGYRAIALSTMAIAMLGFIVWGHHMFVSGQSEMVTIIFSALTFLVGIPSGVKVFNWVATLYKGTISLKAPMLYALSFLFLFTIGGVTGVVVGVLSVDVHLHDTYYVVAHFHYVMMGGTVMAILGGVHYWWPKMFGKMYSEFWASIAAALVFIGFNMTFFTQFLLGGQGMPRRYADYTVPGMEGYEPLHAFSTYGSWVLGAGFIVMLFYLLHSLMRGRPAPQNPWGAVTLEWTHATSPPDPHNFERTPLVTKGPYDFDMADLGGDGAVGDGGTAVPVPKATH